MYSVDFAYWLQGYFELTEDDQPLTAKQVQIIRNHLNLVFKHEIDDLYAGDKEELQNIHDGTHEQSSLLDDPLSPGKWPHPGGSDPLFRC